MDGTTQQEELLIGRLREWALLYGKKLSDQEIGIWTGIFKATPAAVLAVALERLTARATHRPTPGMLTAEVERVRAEQPLANIVGEAHCECGECGGLAYRVVNARSGGRCAEKCPCHAAHAPHRYGAIDGVDPSGTMCRIDAQTGAYLYRAVDCEEGRAALAQLSRLAGKMDLAAWYAGGMSGPRDEAA